jgi:hypothetical protein
LPADPYDRAGMPVENNPLAILTFIAAPAVLTNAASVLALGTSNRFGRNVDRARAILKLIDAPDTPAPERALHRELLGRYERRATLLMRAMSLFYVALACFAGGVMLSLVGAILANTDHPWVVRVLLSVALAVGVAGLAAMVSGGALLVRETRLALAVIRREMEFYRDRFAEGPPKHR